MSSNCRVLGTDTGCRSRGRDIRLHTERGYLSRTFDHFFASTCVRDHLCERRVLRVTKTGVDPNDGTSRLLRKILVSTREPHHPLLTERLLPPRRREGRSCAQGLPELKRSTDTHHVTQTGLLFKDCTKTLRNGRLAATISNNHASGVSTIRQFSFLPFTSTQKLWLQRAVTELARLSTRPSSKKMSPTLFHHDVAGHEPNLQHTPEEIVIFCSG